MVKALSAIRGGQNLLMALRSNLEAPKPNYGVQKLLMMPIAHLEAIDPLEMICVVVWGLIHGHWDWQACLGLEALVFLP